MERCFISQKPILDIPGQVDSLQPYLLGPDEIGLIPADAAGTCYIQELAASPYAEAWGAAVRRHFLRNIGLQVLGEVEGHLVLQNPRTKVVTIMLTCGASFDLPGQDALAKAVRKDGWAWIKRTIEYNLHDLEKSVAAEIQQALTSEGTYPLSRLAEHMGVSDCFRQPEVLAQSELVFNKQLKRYWDASSTSSDCTYVVVVPEAVLGLLGF
jgi:hypothetical protein